ncbi:hypothetical protein D3C78_1850280 [compost metagenome]
MIGRPDFSKYTLAVADKQKQPSISVESIGTPGMQIGKIASSRKVTQVIFASGFRLDWLER